MKTIHTSALLAMSLAPEISSFPTSNLMLFIYSISLINSVDDNTSIPSSSALDFIAFRGSTKYLNAVVPEP